MDPVYVNGITTHSANTNRTMARTVMTTRHSLMEYQYASSALSNLLHPKAAEHMGTRAAPIPMAITLDIDT